MKAIKTRAQYDEAMSVVDAMLARSEHLTDVERTELEVLAILIEKYERDAHPVASPTPLEAVKFRMEQMGYSRKELAVLLGGESRVSEFYAGKRALSPAMMRRLRDEWHIPADSLLGTDPPEDPTPDSGGEPAREPKKYPVKQMYDRGYFPGRSQDWKNHGKDPAGLLQSLYQLAAGFTRTPRHCRQGGGAKTKIDPYALEAWQVRVLVRAAEEKTDLPAFDPAALDENFLRWLASLSCLAKGPRLACDELEQKGIAVIIEARLDKTHLDGAALLATGDRPVIGMTLRHNRLDNFWFTLFHEIGHVMLHLSPENPVMFDSEIDHKKTDRIEKEADRFALDTLIPPDIWQDKVSRLHYAADIRSMADSLRLHPAILAGRLRREAGDYRKHPTLIGSGQARAALGFTEKDWPK